MAAVRFFAAFLLMSAYLVPAAAWCINSPDQRPVCSDFMTSGTVGCYAYSSCAATNGQSFSGSFSTVQSDSYSVFLLDNTNFLAYQAGTTYSCNRWPALPLSLSLGHLDGDGDLLLGHGMR